MTEDIRGEYTARDIQVLEGLEGPIALSSCLMDTGVCPAKPGCAGFGRSSSTV